MNPLSGLGQIYTLNLLNEGSNLVSDDKSKKLISGKLWLDDVILERLTDISANLTIIAISIAALAAVLFAWLVVWLYRSPG